MSEQVSGVAVPEKLAKVEEPKAPLALMASTFDEAYRIAKYMSESQLVPDALRGKVYDLLYIVVTGAELGIPPMRAVRDIYIIKGRPYLSSQLRVALVKQSTECEYFRLVSSDATQATFETKRRNEGVTKMTFTVADAERAGKLGRTKDGKPMTDDNWTAWLPVMLRRRCASQLVDEVYPDITRGTSDREDAPERDVGPPIPLTFAPPPPKSPPEDAQVVPPSPPRKLTPVEDVSTKPPDYRPTPESNEQAQFATICGEIYAAKTQGELDAVMERHAGWSGPQRAEVAQRAKDRGREIANKAKTRGEQ